MQFMYALNRSQFSGFFQIVTADCYFGICVRQLSARRLHFPKWKNDPLVGSLTTNSSFASRFISPQKPSSARDCGFLSGSVSLSSGRIDIHGGDGAGTGTVTANSDRVDGRAIRTTA